MIHSTAVMRLRRPHTPQQIARALRDAREEMLPFERVVAQTLAAGLIYETPRLLLDNDGNVVDILPPVLRPEAKLLLDQLREARESILRKYGLLGE